MAVQADVRLLPALLAVAQHVERVCHIHRLLDAAMFTAELLEHLMPLRDVFLSLRDYLAPGMQLHGVPLSPVLVNIRDYAEKAVEESPHETRISTTQNVLTAATDHDQYGT